VTSL
jgi:hypothetical protein